MTRAPALLTLSLLALGGCAADDARYPSLLPRPIETMNTAEPVRPEPVAAPDPALDRRIATTVAAIEAASADFTATAQKAEAAIAVARGVAEGSRPWLDAQTGLADLAAMRAPMEAALSDLRQMAIERGTAGLPPYPALDAAIARAETLSEAQAKRLASLDAEISAK